MHNAFRHFFCVLIDDAAFLKAGKISPHSLGHGNRRFPNCLMAMGFGLMLILAMVAQSTSAQTVTATITADENPRAVAINPVTNKIYVANTSSNNVTVIDGANNATTTLAAGRTPIAVAINPVTNKIYVVNQNSDNITVIDGATNAPLEKQ